MRLIGMYMVSICLNKKLMQDTIQNSLLSGHMVEDLYTDRLR